jgi:hypothetical protein
MLEMYFGKPPYMEIETSNTVSPRIAASIETAQLIQIILPAA